MAHILIIDSHAGRRSGMAVVLGGAGHRVWATSTGADALACASDVSVRLHRVVSRWLLPDTHGRAVVSSIRKLHPEVPVLYTTLIRRRLMDSDLPCALLRSPYSSAELLTAVERLLDGTSRDLKTNADYAKSRFRSKLT